MLHGTKQRYQVLLDPHKAALIEALAERKDKNVSQLLREMVYEVAARECDTEEWAQAHELTKQDQMLMTIKRRQRQHAQAAKDRMKR